MATAAWNNAFEIDPADTDVAGGGAADIRSLKLAIRERMIAGGHLWNDGLTATSKDGLHAVDATANTFVVYKEDKVSPALTISDVAVVAGDDVDYIAKDGRRVGVRRRQLVFHIPGTLVLGSTAMPTVELALEDGEVATVVGCRAFIKTVPAGDVVTCSILRAAASSSGADTDFSGTVVTTTIAAAAHRSTPDMSPAITTLNQYDMLRPTVTNIGTTTAGADLTIVLILEF